MKSHQQMKINKNKPTNKKQKQNKTQKENKTMKLKAMWMSQHTRNIERIGHCFDKCEIIQWIAYETFVYAFTNSFCKNGNYTFDTNLTSIETNC